MAQRQTTSDVQSEKVIVAAIVLAGGVGTRFGGPKYAATLHGRRLVDRAIDLVRPLCRDVVVVLPPGHTWDGDDVSGVATGGVSRTESLRTALPLLRPDVEVVVTHDCVRPLASTSQLVAAIDAVLAGADAAIPGWEPPDPVKRVLPDGSIEHVGREGLVIVQSPSAYRRSTLDRVFAELEEIPIDESMGVELIGGRVESVVGDRWSHHLVDERDLAMFGKLAGATPADLTDLGGH